ncbi:MAG TPA: hypothetical protein VGX23_10525 [Actinocrinis sp.]|nr:hypothetical protein [Actinocrinis sp.]
MNANAAMSAPPKTEDEPDAEREDAADELSCAAGAASGKPGSSEATDPADAHTAAASELSGLPYWSRSSRGGR